jgi:hypothetical protein
LKNRIAVLASFVGMVRLFPEVFFVPFQAMFLKEFSEFVLVGHGLVVLGLVVNVAFDFGEVGGADGEGGVSALPLKILEVVGLGFEPVVGGAF